MRHSELTMRAARALSSDGFSHQEIQTLLRISARFWAADPGVIARNDQICALYSSGKTLEEIAMVVHLTRERVRQILKKRGITKFQGGYFVVARSIQEAEALANSRKREAESQSQWGCDYETACRINGGRAVRTCGPIKAFWMQRRSAATRGIDWLMTLPQWWEVWQTSGKWAERGRGKNLYCMARLSDVGPYSVDNVHIITNSQNASDSFAKTSGAERAANARRPAEYSDTLLSPRQQEIWDLWQAGLGRTAIAERLGIKPETVGSQLCSIKTKLRGDGRAVAPAAPVGIAA